MSVLSCFLRPYLGQLSIHETNEYRICERRLGHHLALESLGHLKTLTRFSSRIRRFWLAGSALRCGGLLLLSTQTLQAAEGVTTATPEETASAWTTNISLLEEYRLRIASHTLPSSGPLADPPAANQQVDQRMRLQADAQVDGMNEHFRGLFSGALWWDLDGAPQQGTPNLFATQYDRSNPWVAPYSLSAEWRNEKVLDHARVGRQATEHGLPLTFDGASLGLRPFGRPLLLYAFGGRTVHFFETVPNLFENWVASTGAVIRPSPTVQLELDSRLVQERVPDWETAQRIRITNFSYGLAATTKSEFLYSKAYARGIDNRVSHAGGALLVQLPSARLGFDARVNAQLVTLGEVVESENPFYSMLGPSLPYARFKFEAWKEFPLDERTTWSVHAGWRGRQLLGVDEQPFNRNSGGIYLHTRIDDLIRKGIFVGGTAEWNYVPRAMQEGWLLAFGGSAGYTGSIIKTEVGTYYQRFKINYYQQPEELFNSRTIYGSLAYRVATWLELRARYDFEILDRYLQSFFLSARQDF